MGKDSEATRRRILEAGAAEFAEYGVAGARIDRIAAAAASNKQLIYQHFGSKDGLFRAVLLRELALASEGVAFPPDDVESYAAAYFDFAMANPRVMRLVAWSGLEAKGPPAGESPARPKLALLAAAQRAGTISDRFSPEFILSTISAVCTAWVPSNWYGSQLDPDAAANAARHRDEIVRLVGLMVRRDS